MSMCSGGLTLGPQHRGATPLHWAADKCEGPVVEKLLAAGAAVEAVANDGVGPRSFDDGELSEITSRGLRTLS